MCACQSETSRNETKFSLWGGLVAGDEVEKVLPFKACQQDRSELRARAKTTGHRLLLSCMMTEPYLLSCFNVSGLGSSLREIKFLQFSP